MSLPLLITYGLTDILPFCLRSCRLCLGRELCDPAGRHGTLTCEFMSGCTLISSAMGSAEKKLPFCELEKGGREAGVRGAAQAESYRQGHMQQRELLTVSGTSASPWLGRAGPSMEKGTNAWCE